MRSEVDSVPLIAIRLEKSTDVQTHNNLNLGNVKLIFMLFFLFLFIRSDFFTDNVISGFGDNAVIGRDLTSWGVMLEGIFLVLFYILAIYLTENKII